ncbi:MAG: ion transporter, partial [Pseudomonadota bacterium]
MSFAILFFILATGIAVAVETMPNLPPATKEWLILFEFLATGVFAVEYVLRLIVARRPLRYAFSFWGIVDLLAFLPTFLIIGGDTLAIRTLRLLRLLRLLKLLKRETVFGRLWGAIASIFDELLVVAVSAFLMIFLAA